MIQDIFVLAASLFLLVKGAMYSTRYAVQLAENFRLSKYVVGLIVVAVISILPETFVAVNSSLSGIPEFGLGTLFGSNVADFTLVFAVIVFLTRKSISVDSKILKNNIVYPFMFAVPVIMGLNGYLSRAEGAVLIVIGAIFYYFELKNGLDNVADVETNKAGRIKNIVLLVLSMTLLLVSSHFTVTSASGLAAHFGVSPVLIGMLVVGIGTTIPEFLFSLQAVRQHDDSLAVGDILGTVLADATIVVGILAMINPFYFSKNIVYVSGVFMLCAAFVLSYFLRTGKELTRKEGVLLVLFWLSFALAEYFING